MSWNANLKFIEKAMMPGIKRENPFDVEQRECVMA